MCVLVLVFVRGKILLLFNVYNSLWPTPTHITRAAACSASYYIPVLHFLGHGYSHSVLLR